MGASEYLDDRDTLKIKVAHLAKMIRASKKCVFYTGAGISTASGTPDYASKVLDLQRERALIFDHNTQRQRSLSHARRCAPPTSRGRLATLRHRTVSRRLVVVEAGTD